MASNQLGKLTPAQSDSEQSDKKRMVNFVVDFASEKSYISEELLHRMKSEKTPSQSAQLEIRIGDESFVKFPLQK